MKFNEIITTANKNLASNRTRTILTILALFIGAFTFTLTLAVGEGVKRYIDEQIKLLNVPDTFMVGKGAGNTGNASSTGLATSAKPYDEEKGDALFLPLTADDIDKIRLTPGVKRVEPNLMVMADYLEYADKKFNVKVDQHLETMQIALLAGSHADVINTPDGLALGYAFIEAFGFTSPEEALDKEVRLMVKDQLERAKVYSFVIKAVMSPSILLNTQIYLNRARLQEIAEYQAAGLTDLLNKPMFATAILEPGSPEEQMNIRQALANVDLGASTYADMAQSFTSQVALIQTGLAAFSLIAILASAFGIINTLLMAVNERTKEIGLMKSLGMPDRRIFSLFASEAFLIGLWGSLAGVVLAILAGNMLNGFAATNLLKNLPGFTLFVFPVPLLLAVLLGISLIALIAGTAPALKAMRLDPITALRYE